MKKNPRKHGDGSEKIRKITKTGSYTYYVTIPKSYMDELGWRERQLVEVNIENGRLVISDWPQ
ncbi:AbrB/MazE/SpoVT family DNA-binding domain-containing protein [bacterium]|nr:AbrB/MazE/SpoVT family DNA-binding domain-containing protein [bacterium]